MVFEHIRAQSDLRRSGSARSKRWFTNLGTGGRHHLAWKGTTIDDSRSVRRGWRVMKFRRRSHEWRLARHLPRTCSRHHADHGRPSRVPATTRATLFAQQCGGKVAGVRPQSVPLATARACLPGNGRRHLPQGPTTEVGSRPPTSREGSHSTWISTSSAIEAKARDLYVNRMFSVDPRIAWTGQSAPTRTGRVS